MKKYQIIYADPPWKFGSIRSSKKINGKYQYYKPDTTVGLGQYNTVEDNNWIKQLPIENIADNDCVLFLWFCEQYIQDALDAISAWGFKYVNIAFIWNKKEKSGKDVCYYGGWTMRGSEMVMLATKGKIHSYIKSHKVRQKIEAVRDRKYHSRKPDIVKDKIVELMGELPRIELFARQKTEGWDVWGNEVESDIDLPLTP
jgi:site-specific DNA-methyltransferase (adenine-specific)